MASLQDRKEWANYANLCIVSVRYARIRHQVVHRTYCVEQEMADRGRAINMLHVERSNRNSCLKMIRELPCKTCRVTNRKAMVQRYAVTMSRTGMDGSLFSAGHGCMVSKAFLSSPVLPSAVWDPGRIWQRPTIATQMEGEALGCRNDRTMTKHSPSYKPL